MSAYRYHTDLVDRSYTINGVTYKWCGWFGCQLESVEWRKPPQSWPERNRKLLGFDFEPFTVNRVGVRWRITWCLTEIGKADLTGANQLITAFRKELVGFA